MTRFSNRHPLGLIVMAALALAACSGREEAEKAASSAPPAAVAPQASAPQPASTPQALTVGGDGSAITLSALTPADLETDKLSGELGCSFSTPSASPLLLAMGNVASREPAQGLVKVGDYVERVSAPDGFDGMLKGAVFTGRGKTIRIVLTGPAVGGGESPPRPATLTYERADGASSTLVGGWECGP